MYSQAIYNYLRCKISKEHCTSASPKGPVMAFIHARLSLPDVTAVHEMLSKEVLQDPHVLYFIPCSASESQQQSPEPPPAHALPHGS